MTLWRQWIWSLTLWLTRKRTVADVIDFRESARNIRRLLIHLPAEYTAAQFSTMHRKLVEMIGSCEITVVAREGLSDETVETARVATGVREIRLLGENDFGWRDNVRSRTLNALKQNTYDIVLDYNRSFDLAMAYALRAVGAPVMAGMVSDQEAERFYNLIVQPSTDQSDAMTDCLSMLR